MGWYRISQEANEGMVAAGVLEVADGSPAPAPLWPVDQAAISVQPPLVAPDGEMATLSALIPAPTGTQTIDDVGAAVQGLAEAAAIERWDDGAWAPVAAVDFASPPPRPPDYSRTVELPALPGGAYRLIRSSPRGEHVGHFWVGATDATPETQEDPGTSSTAPGVRDVLLTKWGACGEAFFWATNETGNVAVTVQIDVRKRAPNEQTTVKFSVPDPDVTVKILGGKNLAKNQCTDLIDPAAEPTATQAAASGQGAVVLGTPFPTDRPPCGDTSGSLVLTGLVGEDGITFAPVEVTSDSIGCYAG